MTKVTRTEFNMLRYFHEDKGDVTCWSEWEKVAKKYPEIKFAYDQMINSQKVFDLVINGLDIEDDDDDEEN